MTIIMSPKYVYLEKFLNNKRYSTILELSNAEMNSLYLKINLVITEKILKNSLAWDDIITKINRTICIYVLMYNY